MTEEEAKTKWCPLGRALYAEGNGKEPDIAVALNTDKRAPTLCIGSACMLWRWDFQKERRTYATTYGEGDDGDPPYPSRPDTDDWVPVGPIKVCEVYSMVGHKPIKRNAKTQGWERPKKWVDVDTGSCGLAGKP